VCGQTFSSGLHKEKVRKGLESRPDRWTLKLSLAEEEQKRKNNTK